MRMPLLRAAAAALILFLVIMAAGPAALWDTLCSIEIRFLIYLLLLSVVMVWVSCLKWQLFIQAFGHAVPMRELMRLYTIGYFYNVFLPSYVGGDAARSYQLGRILHSQKEALICTFLERFTGLLAMVTLATLCLGFGVVVPTSVVIPVLFAFLGALVLALMCFSGTISRVLWSWVFFVVTSLGFSGISRRMNALFQKLEISMSEIRKSPQLFLNTMLLSFAFHMLTVLNTYLAARAVSWESPDIGGLFVVVPLVLLVSMLPITPSGIGIQEGAFLFFLERIGATQAQGLGVGLVLRMKVLLVALLGGLLWSLTRDTGRLRSANTAAG